MIGRVDFKEEGKFWRENERENLFRVCLVGWEGKELVEPNCFLPKPSK